MMRRRETELYFGFIWMYRLLRDCWRAIPRVVEKIEVCLEKEFHENEQNASCFRIDDVLTQSSNLSNVVPLWQFSHSKISIEMVALLAGRS